MFVVLGYRLARHYLHLSQARGGTQCIRRTTSNMVYDAANRRGAHFAAASGERPKYLRAYMYVYIYVCMCVYIYIYA